jgi:plastocyanin
MTGGAYATEHEVTIVAGAFYPEITYVQPGDTVTFYNADDTPRRVFGDEYHFKSPNLQTGDEYVITVFEGMPNDYYAKAFTVEGEDTSLGEGSVPAEEAADVDEDGKTMRGVLSFAPPPLED